MLILPPSRASLGVFLHDLFCSLMWVSSSQKMRFGLPTLPTPVAVSPCCLLSLQSSPIYSWLSTSLFLVATGFAS